MARKITYNSASQVELVKSGNDFFQKAYKIMEESQHSIHLQTYIFSDDETGIQTIRHLSAAVKRGVEVFLLVDAFGSHELKAYTIKAIQESGIHFRTYSPLIAGYRLRFGRRLHHKILVSDEKEALIGGINFDNHYHLKGKDSPWLDYAVYLQGNICEEIFVMCRRLWSGKGYFRKKRVFENINKETLKNHDVYVKLQQNDWLYGKKGISHSINNSIRHAHSSVTIMASYFLPGGKIRRSLKNAAKRNVKIRIILPGISDVTLVKYAIGYWYAWMLRNKIELYEWNKTILHGKLITVDDDWVSIGSYNINHLSHFSSIETNVDIKDKAFSDKVKAELNDVMNSCYIISVPQNGKRITPFTKFLFWSSFQIIRFLFSFQFAVLSKE